jgi:hypothetical protein
VGRRVLTAAAVASLAAVPAATATATAAGSSATTTTRHCRSADLRYPFRKGLPDDFGVWRLKVTGGTCRTAHTVAKRWQRRFEASPTATLPRRVDGFRFRSLPPREAQTYRLRGTREATVVRFDYVVPNG